MEVFIFRSKKLEKKKVVAIQEDGKVRIRAGSCYFFPHKPVSTILLFLTNYFLTQLFKFNSISLWTSFYFVQRF